MIDGEERSMSGCWAGSREGFLNCEDSMAWHGIGGNRWVSERSYDSAFCTFHRFSQKYMGRLGHIGPFLELNIYTRLLACSPARGGGNTGLWFALKNMGGEIRALY